MTSRFEAEKKFHFTQQDSKAEPIFAKIQD